MWCAVKRFAPDVSRLVYPVDITKFGEKPHRQRGYEGWFDENSQKMLIFIQCGAGGAMICIELRNENNENRTRQFVGVNRVCETDP